jgi:hypothetical protein
MSLENRNIVEYLVIKFSNICYYTATLREIKEKKKKEKRVEEEEERKE